MSGANALDQLEGLIQAAQEARQGYERVKVSPSSVKACRTALDVMLPAMAMHTDPRVRALAMQAWEETRDLKKREFERLTAYLEDNPL